MRKKCERERKVKKSEKANEAEHKKTNTGNGGLGDRYFSIYANESCGCVAIKYEGESLL